MSRTAVITGATSGIGAAFAKLFAEKGYDLLVTGRREDTIRPMARILEKEHGISVQVLIAELSDAAHVNRLLGMVKALPRVDVLINNAGFGRSGPFGENSERHRAMLNVHVVAPLRLIETVIPGMKERKKGIIINVSSLAAFFPLPGSSTYTATKVYLNSFSESLQMELADFGITVQALCPGMTRTDFHRKMGDAGKEIERKYVLKWMDPKTVAKRSLRHIKKNKVIYIPGTVNKLMARLIPRLPRRLYFKLAKKAGA